MPTQSPARILTVEDDPIVRADLRLVLEDAGFDVLPDARDGIEAVDHAREHRPDLILTLRIALTERGRRNDENERRRQLLLIDSLVRRGYEEAQIIAALEDRETLG